jgi:hypothetical protein
MSTTGLVHKRSVVFVALVDIDKLCFLNRPTRAGVRKALQLLPGLLLRLCFDFGGNLLVGELAVLEREGIYLSRRKVSYSKVNAISSGV